MKLNQRVAIITGAGSGIGRAMALQFSREGAHILAADVNETAVETTASEIMGNGGKCETCTVDVTSPEQVKRMVDVALQVYDRIDILCNNAGIGSTTDVVDCQPDEWDRVMAVNVRSVFLGCKYVIPHMIEQGGGVIINTASVAGMVGIAETRGVQRQQRCGYRAHAASRHRVRRTKYSCKLHLPRHSRFAMGRAAARPERRSAGRPHGIDGPPANGPPRHAGRGRRGRVVPGIR